MCDKGKYTPWNQSGSSRVGVKGREDVTLRVVGPRKCWWDVSIPLVPCSIMQGTLKSTLRFGLWPITYKRQIPTVVCDVSSI